MGGMNMTIGELIAELEKYDKTKQVIIIIDGDTLWIESVYKWDDVGKPSEAPIELIIK